MSGYDDFFKKARKQSQAKQPPDVANVPRKLHSAKGPEANDSEFRLMSALGMNRKKKMHFPWRMVVLFFVGFMVAGSGLLFVEDIDSVLNRIEVGLFDTAEAQAKSLTEQQDPPTSPINKKTKDKTQPDALESKVSKAPWSEGGTDHLKHLRVRKSELDAREKDLQKFEEELARQKDEVDKKLAELSKMRAEIANLLKERVQADDAKVEKLVEFYSNMKPQMSSKIFETLDEDLAVEVLGRMKKKSAAEIMNLLSPEKAQTLSEKFAGYKAQ